MPFRITGLPNEPFLPLFDLSDDELAAQCAVRQIADDRTPGYPCRISLTDSQPGDRLVLTNYEHHAIPTPYRMRYAIYVRPGEERYDAVDEIPEQLRTRMLAARTFDGAGMTVDWELVDGRALEEVIDRLLGEPAAAYMHLHYAAAGCYAARVDRA